MYIRPEDLANLCAIYAELGTSSIAQSDLLKYIQTSMALDSNFCIEELISTALECNLLAIKNKLLYITKRGKTLSSRQKKTSRTISEPAKEYLLKNIYLSPECYLDKHKDFLLGFQADTFHETFIYHRSINENHEDIKRLKILYQLDFFEIDGLLVKIRKESLGFFNDILQQLRRGIIKVSFESSSERMRVGEIAEELALKYEKERLIKLGHKVLCSFVQQISSIDMSAGYDIISFRGTGKLPEEKIYIEVKGTKKTNVDFVWTSNERNVAGNYNKKYWIYIFTEINTKKEAGKGPIRINNPVLNLEKKGYAIEPIDIHIHQ